ncbi:hypothetical protein ABT294_09840 [Nonomuraea sp. NPDC000554]
MIETSSDAVDVILKWLAEQYEQVADVFPHPPRVDPDERPAR